MPEPGKFLHGFNLIYGTQMGQYTLINADSTHRTVRRYQEYAYDITLIFKPNTGLVTAENYKELYNQLVQNISTPRTIYGIRNPYRCIIDIPPMDDYLIHRNELGNIVFHLSGHAYRS